jgi:ketosteroid isomerase-like protein
LAKAATYTAANPNVDDMSARIQQSSRFYSYREPRLPYFTPVTPIVPSAKEYIDDLNTTMEWYQSQGIKFRVEIGDLQVRQRGAMAVSVGSMKSILTFPDGSEEINPSRWTVVLEKEGGTWLSIHEHLSFYDEAEQKKPVVETFKKDIIEFKKKSTNK